MHLKGALHTHTTCSDGELTVFEVIRVYESLGFDFIALTDHDYLLNKACYQAIHAIQTDLIVFTGVEMTVFEKGYLHVNRIQGDQSELHIFNHPAELNLSLGKAKDRIDAIQKRMPIDAIEVTTKGFRTPEFENDAIPLPKVASDDSHTRQMCGRAWIELDCQRDKDQILHAIKHNNFWNCYA